MAQGEQQRSLHGDYALSIYCIQDKLLTTQQCLNILLDSNLKSGSICTKVPFSVNCSSVFVIDMGHLGSPADVRCDDIMGTWKWKGSYRKWCTIDEIGDVEMLDQKPGNEYPCLCYQIWKRYYEHKSSGDVKKLIVLLEGGYIYIGLAADN